jgi:hypothetical protein
MWSTKKNEIDIDGRKVIVEIKQPSFFEVQMVAPLFSNPSLDFSEYWQYAFTHWAKFTPSLDIKSIDPETGAKIASLLPQPPQIMEWLVFREAELPPSKTSSTEGEYLNRYGYSEKGWSIS